MLGARTAWKAAENCRELGRRGVTVVKPKHRGSWCDPHARSKPCRAATAHGYRPSPRGSEPPARPPDFLQRQLSWPVLDRPGLLRALDGLILGLIACSAPMTTSPSPAAPSHSPINGASPASLPRHMGATLNWLRDPGSAQRMQHYEQRRMQHEQRMKQSRCRRSRPEAMARERQRESLEHLDQAALLAARVQLDPTALNRERLRTFFALRGQGALGRPHPWSFSASPISASPTSRTFRPLLGSESAPHSSSPTHEGGGRC